MNYREAEINDTEGIVTVNIAGWRYAYKGILDQALLDNLNYSERVESRKNYLKQTKLNSFVCAKNSEIIGFVDFDKYRGENTKETEGEVWAIYVLPEYIGTGVGKRLLDIALIKMRDEGINQVFIWVLEGNSLARHFYESQGFVASGTKKEYSNSGVFEIRYEKNI